MNSYIIVSDREPYFISLNFKDCYNTILKEASEDILCSAVPSYNTARVQVAVYGNTQLGCINGEDKEIISVPHYEDASAEFKRKLTGMHLVCEQL